MGKLVSELTIAQYQNKLAYDRLYKKTHRIELAAQQREYYLNNKKRYQEYEKTPGRRLKNHNYHANHAEYLTRKMRDRYWKNPDASISRVKEWALSNKDKLRATYKLRTYGLTEQDWDYLWNKQNGQCSICLTELQGSYAGDTPGTAIDHDHKTGLVRGLLCTRCNLGIGFLKDDANIVQRAWEYLNKR